MLQSIIIAFLLLIIPRTVAAQSCEIYEADMCSIGYVPVTVSNGDSIFVETSKTVTYGLWSFQTTQTCVPDSYEFDQWYTVPDCWYDTDVENSVSIYTGEMDCGTPVIMTVTICDQPPQYGVGPELELGWFDYGCDAAAITTCTITDSEARVYANGINAGTCVSTPVTFDARPYMTNTLTIVSDNIFDLTVFEVQCTSEITTSDTVTRSAILTTPGTYTPTASGASVLGGSGFLGISFGGDLSNPSAPINIWLGHATDFIDIVNTGNILYIIGAVGAAAAVLGWAIHTVRNPESF